MIIITIIKINWSNLSFFNFSINPKTPKPHTYEINRIIVDLICFKKESKINYYNHLLF